MACFLVFTEAEEGRWWSKYLKPGFRHVSILTLTAHHWVLVRPLYGLMMVEACPYHEGDIPQDIIDGEAVIVSVKVNATDRLRSMVGLHTCVSFAKAMMGVRHPLVWTPWQLYKLASSRYAVDIHSTGDSHSGSEHQPEAEAAG